jgi:hypothetical protein
MRQLPEAPRTWVWVIKMTMLRLMGDNDEDDDVDTPVLVLCPEHCAAPDVAKLAKSPSGCRRSAPIDAIDCAERPAGVVVEASEVFAAEALIVGPLEWSDLDGLVRRVSEPLVSGIGRCR